MRPHIREALGGLRGKGWGNPGKDEEIYIRTPGLGAPPPLACSVGDALKTKDLILAPRRGHVSNSNLRGHPRFLARTAGPLRTALGTLTAAAAVG
jgi:hypothetical protein